MNRVKWVNVVFLSTVLVSSVGGTLVGLLLQHIGENYFINLLVSQFILIIPTLIYIIYYRIDIREAIRFRKIKMSNIFYLIIFAYLITPLMSLLSAISMLFSTNFITGEIGNIVNNSPLILSVFLVAFIPCVLEESVYRGIFYNEYRKINTRKAIVLSGLLFGLLHMNFNQFIYAFAMGMIFALLIEATDSIISSMIVHFVINATSVVQSYVTPKLIKVATEKGQSGLDTNHLSTGNYTRDDLLSAISVYAVISVVTTILAFMLYKQIAKKNGRLEHVNHILDFRNKTVTNSNSFNSDEYYFDKETYTYKKHTELQIIEQECNIQDNKQKLLSIPLTIGMAMCIILMIYREVIVRIS
ncbi:CPBP family intramembrane glutamic endopeptidase [Anaeromicropila herbilytica]|uniref:CAAX prenyl protease 2/Lysostaphin resistance protein A-like domain-containing protein n=1 Tax=Anaeromicropila herbilytica TaxID=2785025 RepID=A0A7R7EI66_9FIRM|nr:type II CAAX endopeptidase family protein [Anaeromicropila herbilytica]BCN29650.1 hypothetical protein bsdtb5_09450 [Anaeromicropila herbilytica]